VNVARLPATGPGSRIGSLVIDFGGPSPAIDALKALAAESLPPLLSELRTRFDLVAFNRRGFDSDHEIRCFDRAQADALRLVDVTPDSAAEETRLIEWWSDAVARCRGTSDVLSLDVSSATVARDLDEIRAALGDSKLTFLGMSYGTLIGAHYAALFPDRVRAIVLDAPVDPDGDPVRAAPMYAAAANGGLERFLADCADRVDCPFRSDGDPWTAYDDLLADLDAAPLEVPGSHSLSEYDVLAVMRATVASQAGWPALASALADATTGDGRALLAIADWFTGRTAVDYRHLIEQSLAIQCADVAVPIDEAAVRQVANTLASQQPQARAIAWQIAPCLSWPTIGEPPQLTPVPSGAQTIVVIGGLADPQTPHVFAERTAALLGNAVLVSLDGYGHTILRGPQSSQCIDDLVVRYLVDLEVPRDGLTC
jgi:pimeloyl-ACP methyl ester carboxylesterase